MSIHSQKLFREAAHKGAALAVTVPVDAQPWALILVSSSDSGHRVFQFGKRRIVRDLGAARVIALIEGSSLNFGEGSGAKDGLAVMIVITKNIHFDSGGNHPHDARDQLAAHMFGK